MSIGWRRVLIVSPLLLLSILLMLLFLVNSIAGLPPTITSPFCPNEITESGYVEMVEFVQSDCVGAVKGASEQTVPYFQGMDLAAIVFFLVLSLFFVRMLTNSSHSEYKESPRMAAMLDASIWDDETVFEPTPMPNSSPQQNHEEQQNQGGFHNPFDF